VPESSPLRLRKWNALRNYRNWTAWDKLNSLDELPTRNWSEKRDEESCGRPRQESGLRLPWSVSRRRGIAFLSSSKCGSRSCVSARKSHGRTGPPDSACVPNVRVVRAFLADRMAVGRRSGCAAFYGAVHNSAVMAACTARRRGSWPSRLVSDLRLACSRSHKVRQSGDFHRHTMVLGILDIGLHRLFHPIRRSASSRSTDRTKTKVLGLPTYARLGRWRNPADSRSRLSSGSERKRNAVMPTARAPATFSSRSSMKMVSDASAPSFSSARR
jgi:hypothetical protein